VTAWLRKSSFFRAAECRSAANFRWHRYPLPFPQFGSRVAGSPHITAITAEEGRIKLVHHARCSQAPPLPLLHRREADAGIEGQIRRSMKRRSNSSELVCRDTTSLWNELVSDDSRRHDSVRFGARDDADPEELAACVFALPFIFLLWPGCAFFPDTMTGSGTTAWQSGGGRVGQLGRRQNSGVTNPAQDAILPHVGGAAI
jgi:hypothetical protein